MGDRLEEIKKEHGAHHDQPMETCEKNTCQGARKALEAQHEKD